jgi:bifunctional DNA-binding transcriptional regulator/antitoxin component of YhaV-PrlF toxin-antitoxin module
MKKRYVSVQGRGTITLPADVRHEYQLDEPGVQLEVVTRPGVIELHPQVSVPADQAWFWTPEWQRGERAVDEHVAAGRISQAENIDEFLAAMDKLRKTKPSGTVSRQRRRQKRAQR